MTTSRRSGHVLFAQAQIDSALRSLHTELDEMADRLTVELLDGALRRRMKHDSRRR